MAETSVFLGSDGFHWDSRVTGLSIAITVADLARCDLLGALERIDGLEAVSGDDFELRLGSVTRALRERVSFGVRENVAGGFLDFRAVRGSMAAVGFRLCAAVGVELLVD